MSDPYNPTPTGPLGSIRADTILEHAIATMRQRAADRDVEEERTMGTIVKTFNAMTGQNLTEVEGWKFMVILKMVRAQNGGFKADDFVDMAAYVALTGEAAATA